MNRQPREKDEGHLKFVQSLPCCVCLDNTSTEAAHVRYAEPRAGKRHTGMGEKPADRFTVPLCNEHHREQHSGNERAFWAGKEIDPIMLSLALYGVTGNHEAGEQAIRAWH